MRLPPDNPRKSVLCWAQLYSTQRGRGQSYAELRFCVAIWLLGYRELSGERFHSILRVQDIQDREVFSDAFELHLLELPKLGPRRSTGTESKLELWARFLGARSREELEQMAMTGDPDLEQGVGANRPAEPGSQDAGARLPPRDRPVAVSVGSGDSPTAGRGRRQGRGQGRGRT